MMAIHNFHIAVEITLKSIILKYEIRTEKEINIDFESMMSEISRKIVDIKFPYRQDLRSLNVLRGLIQHQGIEPDISSLENFEVITVRFLTEVYQSYFDIDFASLSRVSLIQDSKLRQLLANALEKLNNGEILESAVILDGAFKLVSLSLYRLLPSNIDSYLSIKNLLDKSRIRQSNPDVYYSMKLAFQMMEQRVKQSESLSTILSSGVSLSDLNRFQNKPFILNFDVHNSPIIQKRPGQEITIAECKWYFHFTVSTILSWQQGGLNPNIEHTSNETIQRLIDVNITTL